MDSPCKSSLFFCPHCKAQGTVAAAVLGNFQSALGALLVPSVLGATLLLQELSPLRSWSWLTPAWGELSGAVLSSVLVSRTQTLPRASCSSASLGKQLHFTGTQLLLAEGKESQSSFSHSEINCFSKTSQQQAAGSLTPGKYNFCCSCVTGAGQGRIYHFTLIHCFHIQYF